MKRSDGGDVDSLVPKLKVEISNKTKNLLKRAKIGIKEKMLPRFLLRSTDPLKMSILVAIFTRAAHPPKSQITMLEKAKGTRHTSVSLQNGLPTEFSNSSPKCTRCHIIPMRATVSNSRS